MMNNVSVCNWLEKGFVCQREVISLLCFHVPIFQLEEFSVHLIAGKCGEGRKWQSKRRMYRTVHFDLLADNPSALHQGDYREPITSHQTSSRDRS